MVAQGASPNLLSSAAVVAYAE